MTLREFTSRKVKELAAEGLKIFPDDFLISSDVTSLILPSGALVIGNEFFGSYDVLTAKGDFYCRSESLPKAKYIVYAGTQKNKGIKIPVNEKDIEVAVKGYEKYLDELMRQIGKEYEVQFPEGKDLHTVVNNIFRMLNLSRL